MITKITGKLLHVADDSLTLSVGAFEYQVLIPEFVRRQLQKRLGERISLDTIEYLEGNPAQGRLVPRLVGFLSHVEREFFELFFFSNNAMDIRKFGNNQSCSHLFTL